MTGGGVQGGDREQCRGDYYYDEEDTKQRQQHGRVHLPVRDGNKEAKAVAVVVCKRLNSRGCFLSVPFPLEMGDVAKDKNFVSNLLSLEERLECKRLIVKSLAGGRGQLVRRAKDVLAKRLRFEKAQLGTPSTLVGVLARTEEEDTFLQEMCRRYDDDLVLRICAPWYTGFVQEFFSTPVSELVFPQLAMVDALVFAYLHKRGYSYKLFDAHWISLKEQLCEQDCACEGQARSHQPRISEKTSGKHQSSAKASVA